MRVLVIGGGGREHAMCWKARQSPKVTELFCAPGNPGIAAVAQCVAIAADNVAELTAFAEREKIDLTIVGPEQPLSLGLADEFGRRGLRVFGPVQAAARLESSKAFAKEMMVAAGVPTAGYRTAANRDEAFAALESFSAPFVVKCDSLAAGKGVFICPTEAEAREAVEAVFGKLSAPQLVIEEYLDGVEASVIAAVHGRTILPFPPAHDYKRLQDGDAGPNTGGMGNICPTPRLSPETEQQVYAKVFAPLLDELARRDIFFSGFLYAGLMIRPSGEFSVLEFNCRLGDPEAQVMLPLIEDDLVDAIDRLLNGEQFKMTAKSGAATCVVLASRGYPDGAAKGDEITGLDLAAQLPSTLIFHAGTARGGRGELVTAGGRVLNVVGFGAGPEESRRAAYRASDMIQFKGRQCRRDIGA